MQTLLVLCNSLASFVRRGGAGVLCAGRDDCCRIPPGRASSSWPILRVYSHLFPLHTRPGPDNSSGLFKPRHGIRHVVHIRSSLQLGGLLSQGQAYSLVGFPPPLADKGLKSLP
jgi:hypothetical protein